MSDFDDVFSRKSIPTGDEEPASEPVAREPEKQPDSKPEPTPIAAEHAEDEADTPEPEKKPDGEQKPDRVVPLSVLRDERRKRQEAEARASVLEREREEARKQAAAPKPKAEDEDDAESAFYRKPTDFIKSRIDAALAQERETSFQRNLALSEQRAREQFTDFDAAKDAFIDAARRYPDLAKQMRDHYDPAKYAYDVGKMITETQGIGSVSDWKAKVEAEVTARLTKEFSEKHGIAADTDVAPPSPGTARGRGASRIKPESTEDEHFASVFAKRRRSG